MNIVNWLLVFIVSLLGIGALGYLVNRSSRRHNGLWSVLSLAFASLICATLFATLFVHSPTVASTMQAAAAQRFTCIGTPALVRAGDAIAITGVGEPDSTITVRQGETTLVTTTVDAANAFEAAITLNAPGVQTVICEAAMESGETQSVTLSFLVIGQAAVPATPPPATSTPAPATNTPAPTATATPTVDPPVIDMTSIPEQILPGETFRLRGTAAGGDRVRVAINNRVVGGAVAGPDGSWRTTIGFAGAGAYTVTAQLVENDVVVAESEPVLIEVLAPEPTSTPAATATNTPAPTATNTNTPEPTATNTPEPTATNTPEPTATNTLEPTATNTPEPTATHTPEPTATNTPEPTATNTPEPTATNTATNTPEPTATNTPEPTATNTPEPTATNTPEPTATNTPEPTATNTPEPTATYTPTAAPPVVDMESIPEQILPGETFRLRGTAANGDRVRVAINNRVVGGAVAGPDGSWRTTIGFAGAGAYTVTAQLVENDAVVAESEPVIVEVLAPTPTPTHTPEPTATNTPEPTATDTPEPTATNTATPEPTATNTPEPTATNTPEPTATNTATNTPEPTATNTPEPTATNTPEPTATNTPEPTATNTPEPTATNTATSTPEPTATNTPEPTATNTATNTPEPTATEIPAAVPPVVDMGSIPAQILPGETFRLSGTAAGSARVHVTINNRVVGSAVAGPNGNWRTTVGFASAGAYTVTAQLIENDTVVAESEPVIVEVLQPTPTSIPEATATLILVPTATPTEATAAVAISEPAQPAADTAAAPADLPGTGSDFSQGVPWVIMILVLGALLVLGFGRLTNKPAA